MDKVTSRNDWCATTVDDREGERRAFVEQVRLENEDDFGPPARKAVESMLDAGHPHPWAYVYELAQNAIDAGARRISWRTEGEALLFQHDGDTALNKATVRGLSSLGASTKGQDAIGFMGVGFKSVFERFRTARISGFGWRFRFDIGTHELAFGGMLPDWFDALRPHWDPEHFDPDLSYTTAFYLTHPVTSAVRLAEDLARLASPDDPTPLAVLALRGLEQLCIDDVTWNFSVQDGVVAVGRAADGYSRQWQFFRSCYRPDDAAMRRFLEARRELTYHEASGKQRLERSVVALVPLGEDGLPNPPSQGRVYATLPTQVHIPFGFHLQADWLVNLDRQNLRTITEDPWQEAIVQQIPKLVRQVLLWLKEEPEPARIRGYQILSDPARFEGEISDVLHALRCEFIRLLRDLKIVPVLGTEIRRFSTTQEIVRLPGRFLSEFGKRPAWRPDLLFGRDLMDESLLGRRAVQFANWLGWGQNIDPDGIDWTVILPLWWATIEEKTDALLSLWSCVSEREWHHVPVVLTEADGWLAATDTRWLNEAPPSDKEPSGAVVAEALASFLPTLEQRLPPRIRALVSRTSHPGVTWLQERHQEERLADIVRRACADAEHGDQFPLVELLDWAVARGVHRQDLVPQVLTEHGTQKPSAALLADPLVPGGEDRRRLFPSVPALAEDYALIDDQQAVVRFIEGLGVHGDATLTVRRVRVVYSEQAVATLLGIEMDRIEPAAQTSGWSVLDYDFPFAVQAVPFDALQAWLSREHTHLANKGRRKATSYYYRRRTTTGKRRSSWVKALEDHPWILCKDGQRRKPADLLLDAHPDFEDAPVADLDRDLANRLENEGIHFAADVSRSPVLHRLEKQGSLKLPDDDLAGLLEEALTAVDAGTVTRHELASALRSVKLRGVPLDRLVREAGRPGTRSDLGEWVVALSSVDARLAAVLDRIEIELPRTTTGQQALGYLSELWRRSPDSVDEIRAHIASAYRYVLQDLERDNLDRDVWHKAKRKARLYGKGCWHKISDSLVVDDIRSPFIRQRLPDDRIAIASAHLGNTQGQVRDVAHELGVALLSTKINLSSGPQLSPPFWMDNLRTLTAVLANLESRRPLGTITCREHLTLRIEGKIHQVSAYIADAVSDQGIPGPITELMVVGTPVDFSAEAAGQLVAYFRLGQRGESIPWLTAALYCLAEDEKFSEKLEVLASGLGLRRPELPTEELNVRDSGETDEYPPRLDGNTHDHGQDDATRDSDPKQAGTQRTDLTDEGKPDNVPVETLGSSVSAGGSYPKSRAMAKANLLAERLKSSLKGEIVPSDDEDRSDRLGTTDGDTVGVLGDEEYREAAARYEREANREPELGDPRQTGWDIRSVDPETDEVRLIEVKGKGCTWDEDEVVELSRAQVRTAFETTNRETAAAWYLYVVEKTADGGFQVLPIANPIRAAAKWLLSGGAWRMVAEDPKYFSVSP